MYYWWRDREAEHETLPRVPQVSNIKVFIGLTIRLPLPLVISSGPIFTFPDSKQSHCFLYSFILASTYFCFPTSTKISFFSPKDKLTNGVTKSSDKGELRANGRINIFWIDEHEASTWHLSSNYRCGRRKGARKNLEKLSSKINSAICNEKNVNTVSKVFDFFVVSQLVHCLTSKCTSFQCLVNHSWERKTVPSIETEHQFSLKN